MFTRKFRSLFVVALAVLILASAFAPRVQIGQPWSAETLALIAAAVLSLAFSYVPGLNTRFAALAPEYKRLIMAGLMLLVSGYVFLEACTGIALLGVAVTCDQAGAVGLVRVFLLSLAVNQGAYQASPQPAEVQRIAAAAKARAQV